ncbi:bifunctional serine/threonine-protein kinase/ABC transporter substrate-binding protein [Streptomyces sp. NPDC000594]|uniref:bifunctional serine/threonine-protein kinase/ABC transporter substrate-binding protein n=1 Tax=Streptomyces sp. NPDC000594 TaxID=3154261 RepID=UPI00331D4499
MDPLRTGDPATIAGFRLVGRLGAGGMGVVYLARTPGGALAALKVIRAEHAADPGFRARFRREAESARRITGPWVVRVTGADPEASEPWLATEFVPGPSLVEAVAAEGPLPETAVRVLGGRLAEALTAVHRAGLVHRDVKPGNVLLALDGPRLIDFGIARSAGATALTATDAMIGSPGYLSPEQARPAGAAGIGPASDVFSLGCVLAYASTGRRPFGTGTVAAVVFRTVHEEPDLEGIRPGLLEVIRSCLAKDPALRPTTGELGAALADPRTGAPAAGSDPVDGWLPAGLPALIAERSARVLELPVPEPTVVPLPRTPQAEGEAEPGPGERPGPSRRLLVLGSAAAVAGAGGFTTWLVTRPSGDGSTDGTDGTDGVGGTARPRHVLGLQTDLSGPRAADGRAQHRGAQLAVAAFNADPNRPFDLSLKVVDDRGDIGRARSVVQEFGADSRVLAVAGLTTRAIADAVRPGYLELSLPLLTFSFASAAEVANLARRGTFELRVQDSFLSEALRAYFQRAGVERLTVVEDRAAGDLTWEIVKGLRETPPASGVPDWTTVAADSEDFGPAARAVRAARAQAVLYVGFSPARAALLALALRKAGHTGLCGALGPVLEPEFLQRAGDAAEGWILGAAFADPAKLTGAAAKAFTAAYRARWKVSPPERYAAETFDAVGFAAQGIRELDTPRPRRSSLMTRLRKVRHRGMVRTLAFRQETELLDERLGGVYTYRVEGGRARFLGPYRTVVPPASDRL